MTGEDIFYPVVHEAIGDGDLMEEAEVEHASAKQLIAEIQSMKIGDALFDARVAVLGEYVKPHRGRGRRTFPECRERDPKGAVCT